MSIWKELTNPSSFAGQYDTAVECPEPANMPSRPVSPSAAKRESVIGAGVIIDGKVEGDGDIRIGGLVNGDIRVTGNLTLDPGGRILGAINADKATIGGLVQGNITASGHVTLLETGQLIGDVKAKFLTAALGSRVRGKVEFGFNEADGRILERNGAADHKGLEPHANTAAQS